MRLKSIADHHRIVNLADYLGKTAGNYDGSNDVTTLWESALAGSSAVTLEIPAGTYLLNSCDIPVAANRHITLKPLGRVVVKWPSTANAVNFNCGSLWATTQTPTAIADEDNTPSGHTGQQRLTKITMTATSYAIGDLVHVAEDALDGFSVAYGEIARVLDTDGSTYITLNRKLYYPFSAVANIRVRRCDYNTAPRLTMLPGIVFDCNEDETSALASRNRAMTVTGAVEADLSFEAISGYETVARLAGCYQGTVRAKLAGLHVDTSLSPAASGYGVELYGSCFGVKVYAEGDRCGSVVRFGSGTSYNDSSALQNGAPQDCEIMSLVSRHAMRGAISGSCAIRPKVHDLAATFGSETTGNNGTTGHDAVYLAAVDPWFGKVAIHEANSAFALRDHKGVTSTWVIDNLEYRLNTGPSGKVRPIVRCGDTFTVSASVVVNIKSGRSSTPGSYPIERKSADTYGPTVRFSNFTFAECTAVIRSASTRPDAYHLGAGCQYIPGTGHGARAGIVDYTDANSLDLTIEELHIVKNATPYPDGLFTGVAATNQTTKVGRITCDTGVLTLKSTLDNAAATHTLTRIPAFGEHVYTDAAMAGNLTLETGYGTALLDPNGVDRNVTFPDPAKCVGMTKTVRHIGGANNLNILTAAGTISPAAPVLTTGLCSTWMASGTVWYLVS